MDEAKTEPAAPGQMSPEEWARHLAAGLPVIPLRDIILFPGTVTPILLGRPQSLSALMRALESQQQFAFFALQKSASEDEVNPESLKPVGVVGRIASSQSLPNNLSKVLVEAVGPARAAEWKVSPNLIEAALEPMPAMPFDAQAISRRLQITRSLFSEYLGQNPDLPRGVADLIDGLSGPDERVYAMAGHLKIPVEMKQLLVEEPSLDRKLDLLHEFLRNEMDTAALGRRLEHEVRAGIAQSQREYFLGEQLRKIQSELGSFSPPLNHENRQLEERIKAKSLPAKALERVTAEMKRLEYLNPSSPEYSVVRTYVDWFLALPWGHCTPDNLDLAGVKARLDQDHFGLKPVKERILEHVAVFKLSRHRATPILCLVGPPGVGKTSLGKSIALALGREFVRISLGGVRDEAEIRGHRRTYIGSMPGRIVQALKKAQSMNPVILLDELDKMGSDFRGDPASALLEVLDPEQNAEFIDHFMEAGIDLSQVFFVTTANVEEQIPPALHDRLEVIRIAGYFDTEKLAIAKGHLLPKIQAASGLTVRQMELRDDVLSALIRRYTREAGVRQLSRQIAKIARKRAREVVDWKEAASAGGRAASEGRAAAKGGAAKRKGLPALTRDSLAGYLGVPLRQERMVPDKVRPGVITGLAWTPAGGELLRVECTLLSGKGHLHLTGHLGEVMKESARIAVTLARERARRYGIDPEIFQKTDIHLHVPEGSIPKDGPSAGIAMTLALISAMTRRAVDPKIAFTGEISLVGRIHAIGGLPEKSLAALQAGVVRVVLPAENAADVGELPPEAKASLTISQFEHIDPILRELLPAQLVLGPKGGALGKAVSPEGDEPTTGKTTGNTVGRAPRKATAGRRSRAAEKAASASGAPAKRRRKRNT
ncbi:MAG: endopeptidase La [Fibrobacteres bacterium]|nr:endopeptidase La [Fibrobacterota bacterium]